MLLFINQIEPTRVILKSVHLLIQIQFKHDKMIVYEVSLTEYLVSTVLGFLNTYICACMNCMYVYMHVHV